MVRLMALHREGIGFNTCRFLKTLSEKRARTAEWLTLNGNFRQAFQSERVQTFGRFLSKHNILSLNSDTPSLSTPGGGRSCRRHPPGAPHFPGRDLLRGGSSVHSPPGSSPSCQVSAAVRGHKPSSQSSSVSGLCTYPPTSSRLIPRTF